MKVSPFFFPMTLPNMAASNVSRILGLRGYNSTVITACAASNQAMGEALETLRRGAADLILTGGTEAGISQLGLAGFCTMRALSTRNGEPQKASRPFDAHRDGFVPAEGAVILVLETQEHALGRDANILCEVAGFGCTSDAYHPVQPEESGSGAIRALRIALEDAGVGLDEVSYINAHGTSTPLNDSVETAAIKGLFGERAYQIPISSTKSMVGHSLGAAGALDAVPCVRSITDGIIHPTINHEFPDPQCDLDYVPNKARKKDVRVVLSNAFGFGGQNACLVFKRYEEGR
jgi:3-oxoacyl-[acyl-carrier-protein] synthase II